MANPRGNPQNLRPWQPGVSANPGGVPKNGLTAARVESVLSKLTAMTKEELIDLVQDEETPMLEVMVASIIVKAAETGDYSRLEFLLSRSIGRVKEKIELDDVRQQLAKLSREELVKKMEEDLARLKSSPNE